MQGFDQMVTEFLGYLYCLVKEPLVAELWVVSKSYIILCNCGGRFELTLLFWFTIFAKVDGFEKFKIVTCSTLNAELGNVTF